MSNNHRRPAHSNSRRPANGRRTANTKRPSNSRSGVKRKSSAKRGASSSAVKTIITVVAIVAAIAIAGFAAKAVINHFVDSPKSVIHKLEDSFNNRSLTGIIECFDPTTQTLANSLGGIAGAIIGEDNLIDIGDILFQMSDYIDDEDMDEVRNSKIKIIVNNVEKDGDTAIVNVTFKFYNGSELLAEAEDTLNTVKVDGEWYIDGTGLLSGML